MPISRNEVIQQCAEEVKRCLGGQFVLVGGAAMILLGSTRTTNDVDVLVSANEDVSALYWSLAEDSAFSNVGGVLYFRAADANITIDILTTAVETLSFENVQPHLLNIRGIRILKLDYTLAMKIKCFYLRQDDENGREKRSTDIQDVKFLCKMMVEHGEIISDECAEMFQFGCYHMLELRQELSPGEIQDFINIGGRKLILPWDKNTLDQQEYFCCFAEPESDPLAVKLNE
ncbi:hypothetical protein ACJ72_05153 [Emergomyces africanus]|uniref:DUF6036 domain-containing protein n=1 Tax=Emergomyces africanus TaxID=1955775 RepID=A0A1B7NUR4_9EURO|nr:hypothetical protein ACJ72_05153 [Emergomyces africanus]